jgi:hypothetical protein
MGIKKMKKGGNEETMNARMQKSKPNMRSTFSRFIGRSWSMRSVSLLKRLITRPDGTLSKKESGK